MGVDGHEFGGPYHTAEGWPTAQGRHLSMKMLKNYCCVNNFLVIRLVFKIPEKFLSVTPHYLQEIKNIETSILQMKLNILLKNNTEYIFFYNSIMMYKHHDLYILGFIFSPYCNRHHVSLSLRTNVDPGTRGNPATAPTWQAYSYNLGGKTFHQRHNGNVIHNATSRKL